MNHATDLSLALDEEMLGRHGVVIAPPWTPDTTLTPCADLAAQLGDRYLLKYVRRDDRTIYAAPSRTAWFSGVHHVTPSVICRGDLVSALNLPPLAPPRYALLLDPAKLEALGPRRIRGGRAVEYVLPNGFALDAIVPPGRPVEVC
jgi:hypothetical protein